jgi:hypothetical protein
MAFDFPASPTVGQTFPPASPASGTLWLETDTGTLFMWYIDANSSQWISCGAGAVGAPLASPIFTGDPQAPTPAALDSDNSVATTAFTQLAIKMAAVQYNLVNGKLVESHAANAATYAVKTLAGADPSAADPVTLIFPDASILTITAALSLVIPSGASIGGATVPLRLWFALANDAGTPRLIVVRALTGGKIMSFDPRGVISTVAPVGNSACTYYSSVAVTNKPYRVIAFADYESGLATAGTWNVSPTRIMMAGPNTPMPGTVVQVLSMVYTSYTVCSSGSWVGTGVVLDIIPSSPINPIMVECYSDHHFNAAVSSDSLNAQVFRNDNTGLPVGGMQWDWTWAATTVWGGVMYSQKILDFPFTTASTRYRLYGHLNTNSGNYFYMPYGGGTMTLQEIMG